MKNAAKKLIKNDTLQTVVMAMFLLAMSVFTFAGFVYSYDLTTYDQKRAIIEEKKINHEKEIDAIIAMKLAEQKGE